MRGSSEIDTARTSATAVAAVSRQLKPAVAPAPTASADIFRTGTAAPQQNLTGQNRRWAARAPLNKAGWIAAAPLENPVPCIVSNTSKFGAMLELRVAGEIACAADAIPNLFTLIWLSGRVRSEVHCAVRWRSRTIVGVNFVGAVRASVDRRG